MRLLELFSGTGSIGKAFQAAGWEVVSVDLDSAAQPTICCDLRSWDYRQMPRHSFDYIWASPPCTHYSRARTTAKTPRDLDGADAIVRRTLEIIEYFGAPWCLENPQTGLLKEREIMRGLPYVDCTYCSFGYPYKKKNEIVVEPPPPAASTVLQSQPVRCFRCLRHAPMHGPEGARKTRRSSQGGR